MRFRKNQSVPPTFCAATLEDLGRLRSREEKSIGATHLLRGNS
jgi:hypothetical protein